MPILAAIAVPHPPLIIPQVGRGEEKKIQKTIDAMHEAVRFAASFHPDVLIVSTPHSMMYSDWFHISPGKSAKGDFSRYGAPQVQVETTYDTALAGAIESEAQKRGIAAGTEGEKDPALDHATLIPLWFYGQAAQQVPVVRIGLSGLPPAEHYRFGRAVGAAADALGRRAVWIASGDLSHKLKEDGPYGYAPEGPELDKEITHALGRGDFGGLLRIAPALADKGAECGLRSFVMMAGALDGREADAKLLSYEGPFGVGYAVATFEAKGNDDARCFLQAYEWEEQDALSQKRKTEGPYVALARRSIQEYLEHGKRAPLPQGLPEEMTGRKAGVFVSLHKFGELRGCIGTIVAVTDSVAEEIWRNAVSAASEDPRFPPLLKEEEEWLEINVDVLGEAERVESEAALDVKRYGVIVSSGHRRGLLLPDLDGVDTVRQQVDIARRKAGIGENEEVKLERFEVVRHR